VLVLAAVPVLALVVALVDALVVALVPVLVFFGSSPQPLIAMANINVATARTIFRMTTLLHPVKKEKQTTPVTLRSTRSPVQVAVIYINRRVNVNLISKKDLVTM